MHVRLRHVGWWLVGTAAPLFVVPVAVAEPGLPVTAGQSASATIDDLKSQGYDVRINWITGYDTKPLSECRVTAINDPGGTPPSEGVFATVYVDVACPNGDDSGIGFGAGLG